MPATYETPARAETPATADTPATAETPANLGFSRIVRKTRWKWRKNHL